MECTMATKHGGLYTGGTSYWVCGLGDPAAIILMHGYGQFWGLALYGHQKEGGVHYRHWTDDLQVTKILSPHLRMVTPLPHAHTQHYINLFQSLYLLFMFLYLQGDKIAD